MAAAHSPGPGTSGRGGQKPLARRYLALDAMRGLVMLVLVSHALGIGRIKDPRYEWLTLKFEHLRWDGFVPWELIMPSFLFMIGAALPFAMARRREQGSTRAELLRHAGVRTLKLILLGQFLTCCHQGKWAYEPYETLTQLALSYLTCFLILQLPLRWQPVPAAGLMALNWGLYLLFPGSQGPFSGQDNVGAAIDKAVFHLDHAWDWATINFLGSGVTVLFGAWGGMLVRSERPAASKLKLMCGAVSACLALGLLLLPVNPVIHKAWTASFTFVHTACVLSGLALCFWLFDVCGLRRPAFPLVVVGTNSIFIYMLWQLLNGWISKTLAIFTGGFSWFGAAAPALQQCAVAAVLWAVCYWLYRRSIFIRV